MSYYNYKTRRAGCGGCNKFNSSGNVCTPGPMGEIGATGAPGPPGNTGDSYGPMGATGKTGPTGGTGPTGFQGYRPMGPTGWTGHAGPTGWTGSIGSIGPKGLIGSVGQQGPPGGGEGEGFWNGSTGGDISNANLGNVGVFTNSDGPSGPATGWTGYKAMDISGNLRVRAIAETAGLMLTPIHSAEGSTQSAIINLDMSSNTPPINNPLMSNGMFWINQAQDKSAGWSTGTPMDISRTDLGVAALGGKLYAVGGNAWTTPWYFSSAEVYDPINDSWNYIASMDISRNGPGVTVLDGKLYVVGGAPDGAPVGDPVASAEVYDPSDSSWHYIASMSVPRQYPGVAALGGKLYAVGGNNSGGTFLASAEVYDPIDNNWNPIASINEIRAGHGVAALGGKLYAVGGSSGSVSFSSAEVYDPMDPNGGWKYIASMSTSRYGVGVAALGGKLYAVGGKDLATDLGHASAEVYDPMDPSGGWITIDPMSTSRYRFALAALGGKLYAVGGLTDDGGSGSPLKSVEVYDPSLVQMPQITHQGEDFYLSHQRGGPKTFIIPHPEPRHMGKMLRHACIEAPTRGTNLYEYQIEATEDNATTDIELPSYFSKLNCRPYVYISAVTTFSYCYGVVNETLTKAIIYTEKAGIFNVIITGVRKDPDAIAYSATVHIDEPKTIKDVK